jgi:hypothetical protein
MRLHSHLISLAALAAASVFAAPATAQTAPLHVDGTLANTDAQAEEHHRYDDISVRLEAGQRYRFSVDSSAFDPVAQLYRPGAARTDEARVAENDDGDGLNSRITYTPGEAGEFTLRVRAFAADGRGAYAVNVAALPPLPPPVTTPGTPTAVNGTWLLWQGELTDSDGDNDGKHYDDYLIHVDAHQIRYISLEGIGFDPVVQVIAAADRGSDNPNVVDQDDDSGPGLNSLFAFQPDEAGDYIVRVTSFAQNAKGQYRLWITP